MIELVALLFSETRILWWVMVWSIEESDSPDGVDNEQDEQDDDETHLPRANRGQQTKVPHQARHDPRPFAT